MKQFVLQESRPLLFADAGPIHYRPDPKADHDVVSVISPPIPSRTRETMNVWAVYKWEDILHCTLIQPFSKMSLVVPFTQNSMESINQRYNRKVPEKNRVATRGFRPSRQNDKKTLLLCGETLTVRG